MGPLLALRALGTPAAELGFPVTGRRGPCRFHALSGLGARAAIQVPAPGGRAGSRASPWVTETGMKRDKSLAC